MEQKEDTIAQVAETKEVKADIEIDPELENLSWALGDIADAKTITSVLNKVKGKEKTAQLWASLSNWKKVEILRHNIKYQTSSIYEPPEEMEEAKQGIGEELTPPRKLPMNLLLITVLISLATTLAAVMLLMVTGVLIPK